MQVHVAALAVLSFARSCGSFSPPRPLLRLAPSPSSPLHAAAAPLNVVSECRSKRCSSAAANAAMEAVAVKRRKSSEDVAVEARRVRKSTSIDKALDAQSEVTAFSLAESPPPEPVLLKNHIKCVTFEAALRANWRLPQLPPPPPP